MAARLRGLTSKCVFCALAPRQITPILSRQFPGVIPGTVRYRSVKTKPPLRVLKDSSKNPSVLTDNQLSRILRALFERIRPPFIPEGSRRFPSDYDLPNYFAALKLEPQKLVQKFRQFENDVLLAAKSSTGTAILRGQKIQPSKLFTSRAQIIAAISSNQRLSLWLTEHFERFVRIEVAVAGQGAMEKAADLRYPQEWYPYTRHSQRTWYLHVGPTNSGKTYNALQRLKESRNGIYAGPLRLLAYEVYERMNAQGIPCNLVTGDERRIAADDAGICSSTVEMVDISRRIDVAVLDEIQMIGDSDRGWAWTQALLGVRAKEVHMCGEERTVDLITELAKMMGEKLVVKRYTRLGTLQMMTESLNGDFNKLEKGDCVVTFSRKNIFALKQEIESVTGRKCAVIYGSLPPETRSIQAQLFNDPDSEYEILIASDAVGMGLNLSVKRMIFETTVKFNGKEMEPVSVPAIKQIAGRAGRFRVATKKSAETHVDISTPAAISAPLPGLVTSLDDVDMDPLKYAMSVEPRPLRSAGILPSSAHVENFAALFPPETPLTNILSMLDKSALLNKSLFHMCSFKDILQTAQALKDVQGLTIAERLTFCMAPISSDLRVQESALEMAQVLASSRDGSVLKMRSLDLDLLDTENPTEPHQLRALEELHKSLLLYLWLSWRFPATFTPRETAQELKLLCETLIDTALRNIKMTRRKHVLSNHEELLKQLAEKEAVDEDAIMDREEEGESVVPHVADEDVPLREEGLSFEPKEWAVERSAAI